MSWLIPKWLTNSQFIQAQNNAIAASPTTTTVPTTYTTIDPLYGVRTVPIPGSYMTVGPINQHTRTWQGVSPAPPPMPSWARTRNRFAELLHAIEDINGLKFPYDDDIHDMLDMRSFKRTNCQVRLTAFCCFMNCNGVDRHNHHKMIQAAEDMGVEFVP